MNLLVVFVCLGIAVDDIFVVVNAFKQAKEMKLDQPEFAFLSEEDKLRCVCPSPRRVPRRF